MNRNPIIPFVVIMVFGVALMFTLSFKGNFDSKQTAKEKTAGGGAKTTQTASGFNPEEFYKSTCISCHGDQYQGGVGPSLKGVGSRMSVAQIRERITKGKGVMPAGLVPEDKADAMAAWVSKIK